MDKHSFKIWQGLQHLYAGNRQHRATAQVQNFYRHSPQILEPPVRQKVAIAQIQEREWHVTKKLQTGVFKHRVQP